MKYKTYTYKDTHTLNHTLTNILTHTLTHKLTHTLTHKINIHTYTDIVHTHMYTHTPISAYTWDTNRNSPSISKEFEIEPRKTSKAQILK